MIKTDLVEKYILDRIEQKIIKIGQRLPACREVAKELSVNKITVNKAYKILEDKHILYCVPRGGYYLVGSKMKEINTSKVVDFHIVRPDPALIPYRAFTHAMNLTIDEHKKSLFYYDTPLGLQSLREKLQESFKANGVYTSSSQILITHGAQQGIYLALQTLFPGASKNELLVEVPTYRAVLEMAASLQIPCIGINRTVDGINMQELESLLKKKTIKAFYIIPTHHNPTGYSLIEKDKKHIVELCNQYQVYLIEDDYLADLGTDKRTLPLHYYDTNQMTIYIRSFSKTFIPGIRLGATAIPSTLIDTFIKYKYLLDISTSSIPQGALDYFIQSGLYDQHIKKVNACYKRKLLKAQVILTHMSHADLTYHVPKQGIFLWLTFNVEVSAEQVVALLTRRNIQISTSQFFQIDNKKQSLSLCLLGVPEADMDALCDVIEVINTKINQLLPIING